MTLVNIVAGDSCRSTTDIVSMVNIVVVLICPIAKVFIMLQQEEV